MKLAIDLSIVKDVHAIQKVYQVTIISDKGLVFMHKDDWCRICDMIDKCTQIFYDYNANNELAKNFCFWNECFMVAHDRSEDCSCLAICNFELFSLCCKRCNINCVLLSTYNIIDYVSMYNTHSNNGVLGLHVQSNSYNIIEVEDN